MLSADLIAESKSGGGVAAALANLFRYEEARH
jgi:hypothetical protein